MYKYIQGWLICRCTNWHRDLFFIVIDIAVGLIAVHKRYPTGASHDVKYTVLVYIKNSNPLRPNYLFYCQYKQISTNIVWNFTHIYCYTFTLELFEVHVLSIGSNLSPSEAEWTTASEESLGPPVGPSLRIVAFVDALDKAVLSWAGTDFASGCTGCPLGCCQQEPK